MTTFQFFKTALDDYKVGAFVPSSKYIIKRILKLLPRDAQYIVEYGAGDGVITKELLRYLPANGKLVAVELNADFVASLRAIQDDRLVVIHNDIVSVSRNFSQLNMPRIDAVISGIPFTFFKSEERQHIVESTYRILGSNGVFLVYQVSPLMLPYLKRVFQNDVGVDIELRNFPPYFIMKAWKPFNHFKI